MNDIKQLKDKDLKKVAGGNDPERVYHFVKAMTFINPKSESEN